MADFTLSSGSFARPYRSPWGNFPVKNYNISTGISSVAIQQGRLMTLDWTASTTAGRVLPSTALNTGTHFMQVGLAAQDVSGSSAANPAYNADAGRVSIWEANPMMEFKAVTKGITLGSSHVGLRKKLAWDSTLAIQYIDLTASTAADWRVIVTSLIDAEGDSGGYVSFRFVAADVPQVQGSSIALTSTTAFLAFYA